MNDEWPEGDSRKAMLDAMNRRLYLSTFLGGVAAALISIPMILGEVAPNGVYGFRTEKTLSSPRIWYEANRIAGWDMLLAGITIALSSLVLRQMNVRKAWVRPALLLGPVLLAVAHSMWALGRL